MTLTSGQCHGMDILIQASKKLPLNINIAAYLICRLEMHSNETMLDAHTCPRYHFAKTVVEH